MGIKILRVTYKILAFIFGAIAVLGVIDICAHAAGFWGTVFSIFMMPVAGLVAPIYEFFKYGNWWPVLYVYGFGLLSVIFIGLCGSLKEE